MTSIFFLPGTRKHRRLQRDDPPHDIATIIVSNPQPSPEILNAVGHALLRSIATGQGDPLRSAADAIGRLERLLPNASSEARLVATLLALTDDPTPPLVTSPEPQPTSQSQPARRTSKPARPTRNPKPAHPLMDINGRLLSSKGINGIAVISQAEARKALGMSCIQMIKLENQKLLTRIQESGSRLVHYSTSEVQRLLDLIDRGVTDPVTDDDDDDDGVVGGAMN